MKILITGATGFIGRALVSKLRRSDQQITVFARSPETARERLGPGVEIIPAEGGKSALATAVRGTEAVVNLAGDGLFAERWDEARRAALVNSRVFFTSTLVEVLASEARPPRVLVSASAVGFFGDRGDELLDETSRSGEGFLPKLCREWEGAALAAEKAGVRVVLPRIGLVLGPGGLLEKLLPVFRHGAGCVFGTGRQHMSWIHIDDLTEIVALALVDDRFRGVLNATAPAPVTNRELARTLGRVLKRPAILVVPRVAMRVALGESAEAILASQRVRPAVLERLGFRYRFADFEAAVRDAVERSEG